MLMVLKIKKELTFNDVLSLYYLVFKEQCLESIILSKLNKVRKRQVNVISEEMFR